MSMRRSELHPKSRLAMLLNQRNTSHVCFRPMIDRSISLRGPCGRSHGVGHEARISKRPLGHFDDVQAAGRRVPAVARLRATLRRADRHARHWLPATPVAPHRATARPTDVPRDRGDLCRGPRRPVAELRGVHVAGELGSRERRSLRVQRRAHRRAACCAVRDRGRRDDPHGIVSLEPLPVRGRARLQASVQRTAHLVVRQLLQRKARRVGAQRDVGTNTRLRWTFSAMGDLFVVYNHNLRTADPITGVRRWAFDSNQLLVKLQYALRY